MPNASTDKVDKIVGLLGTLSTIDRKYSDVSVINVRLNQFFIANKITEKERKKTILLNTLSDARRTKITGVLKKVPAEQFLLLCVFLNDSFRSL